MATEVCDLFPMPRLGNRFQPAIAIINGKHCKGMIRPNSHGVVMEYHKYFHYLLYCISAAAVVVVAVVIWMRRELYRWAVMASRSLYHLWDLKGKFLLPIYLSLLLALLTLVEKY